MFFIFMILIAFFFTALGTAIASLLEDMQGFNLIMNFLIMPLYFLSGAFYPISNLPSFIRIISYIDPLTYGVDALRGILIGASAMPVMLDMAVLFAVSVVFVILGAYSFDKSESV